MHYYVALENKKPPKKIGDEDDDIERSAIELELVLVTTTDDQPLPGGRFEVMKEYDEIPEEWDRYFPEIKPGGQKGAVKRIGVYFGFSGKADERQRVIDFIEERMNGGE
jgi:hypothetical protein